MLQFFEYIAIGILCIFCTFHIAFSMIMCCRLCISLNICTCTAMGGSRKNLGGGEANIVGIKVAQLNVLLELQLRTSLVISQIPV